MISTDELAGVGYTHPARAARDVREQGIPLDTNRVKSAKTGRMIGAYVFANPDKIKGGRIGGRRAFSKQFKDDLIARYGEADTITGERLDARYLQIDHRIPHEVAGDGAGNNLDVEDYMLIDAANQRAKSWSCEHCRNLLEIKDPAICSACYWGFPEAYKHVAMKPERRTDVVWQGAEVAQFDAMRERAQALGVTPAQLIKSLVERGSGK